MIDLSRVEPIGTPPPKRAVLLRLRELAEGGEPVPARALPKALYRDILAHFGSVAEARRAAGLSASVPPRRRWTHESVLEELRRLHGLGLEVKDQDLKDAGHSGVVAAARIIHGSLVRARDLAGIAAPRRSPRDRQPWDAERVVEDIRILHASGESVASSKVPSTLRLAARRYHGTWEAAIQAAGLSYDDVRLHAPSEPDDVLLERLARLAREQPELTARELDEHELGYLLRRRFPSLAKAARAAGLHDWPKRRRSPLYSASGTLRALRARSDRGLSLHRSAVLRQEKHLLRSAERHFGTWERALETAGFGAGLRLHG